MFCQKCGENLDDDAKFCEKCGANLGNISDINAETKVEDNEIILTVKPKFKRLYNYLGFITIIVLTFISSLFPSVLLSGENRTIMINGIINFFFMPVFIIWFIIIIIRKAEYKRYTYNFYKNKAIHINSFINITEKEIKYKYIREIIYTQNFVQRWFNIGNIVLYTNAESGLSNGILLQSVENVKEVYQEIKQIANV